jgi:hypothetical protein
MSAQAVEAVPVTASSQQDCLGAICHCAQSTLDALAVLLLAV